MELKVINGLVPYVMVAGNDTVSGNMPVEAAETMCKNAKPSKRFKYYPLCVDDKFYFASVVTEKKK